MSKQAKYDTSSIDVHSRDYLAKIVWDNCFYPIIKTGWRFAVKNTVSSRIIDGVECSYKTADAIFATHKEKL